MTLRYLKVTQPDLQREFYRARHNTAQPYCVPSLSVSTATSDLPGIRHALAATRHLLEMYRRQLSDDKSGRRLQRLDRRLLDVDQQLQNIAAGKKMRKDWPVNRQKCVTGRGSQGGPRRISVVVRGTGECPWRHCDPPWPQDDQGRFLFGFLYTSF